MSVKFPGAVDSLSPATTTPTAPLSPGNGGKSQQLASSTGLVGLGSGSNLPAPRLGLVPQSNVATTGFAQAMQVGGPNLGQAMMNTALTSSGTGFEAGTAKMVIGEGKALSNLIDEPVKNR